MPRFKDHFSTIESYSAYRPRYPEGLFDFLAAQAPGREIAWDCATGGGQAAGPLGRRFRSVLATDASLGQLGRRQAYDRVGYAAGLAETAPLADRSIDLITVSQALHWFSFDRFYAEVERLLSPRGVVSAWTYDTLRIDPEVDPLINWMYEEVVGPYWPPQREYVESCYASIPFPFDRIDAPRFEMSASWPRNRLVGYISSWSAVSRFREARGEDPLPEFERRLVRVWPEADAERAVTWRLTVLAGRGS